MPLRTECRRSRHAWKATGEGSGHSSPGRAVPLAVGEALVPDRTVDGARESGSVHNQTSKRVPRFFTAGNCTPPFRMTLTEGWRKPECPAVPRGIFGVSCPKRAYSSYGID